MFFDGSDVGLGGSTSRDVDAFYLLSDGSILLSLTGASSIPGVGTVDDSDILRFVPSSLGTSTSGTFQWYFDGSDVGLTSNGEDVDAITLAANGDLILSTAGGFSVPGAMGADEDMIRFSPTALGASTSGSWSVYFDGSDVGLNDSGNEDSWGTWIDAASGDIYLSTRGNFSVIGASGDGADIFICDPVSLGLNTACLFGPGLYWDGSASGFAFERADGIMIQKP
jgi:hypothetical protein